jgi:hypothetical protein
LFKNKVDVDGARALRDMLKVNSTIQFLDVGYNRLREKGLKAIADGVCENVTSSVTHLGLRFNFISDDGFNYLFENAVLKGNTKITNIYALQNYMSEHFMVSLHSRLEQSGKKLFIDQFERM